MQGLWDGDASNLKAWMLKCPRNQITTLDTHDGIGIVDVADLMTQAQIERTQDNVYKHGANANKRYSSSSYGNLDTYQVRVCDCVISRPANLPCLRCMPNAARTVQPSACLRASDRVDASHHAAYSVCMHSCARVDP